MDRREIIRHIISSAGLAVSILFFTCRIQAQMEHAPEADKNTTFLLHYDKSINPDYCRGVSKADGFASISENGQGRFGEALTVENNLCTNPDGIMQKYQAPVYPAQENFNSRCGTIEMWIKLMFSWDELPQKMEKKYPSLFIIYFVEWKNGQQFNSGGITILANKYLKPSNQLSFSESTRIKKGNSLPLADNAEWHEVYKNRFHLDGDIAIWKKDEWHHVAITWDAEKNERALFLDGIKTASAGSALPDKKFVPRASEFHIGGTYFFPPEIPVMIDELRISDTVRYFENFQIQKQ